MEERRISKTLELSHLIQFKKPSNLDDNDNNNNYKIESRVSIGNFSSAMRFLSNSPLAPFDEITLNILKSKHPIDSNTPLPLRTINQSQKEVLNALKSFKKSSAAGPKGISFIFIFIERSKSKKAKGGEKEKEKEKEMDLEADLHLSEGKTKHLHDAAKRKDSLNSSFEIVEIDSSDDEIYNVCGLKKSFTESSGPRPTQDLISSSDDDIRCLWSQKEFHRKFRSKRKKLEKGF